MNEINMMVILQKIRGICKQCKIPIIPQKPNQNIQPNVVQYESALQLIRQQLLKTSQIQQQYTKLQNLLQKQQTQIRKKIGIQQQFKLYTETLKSQVQELQNQKLQLLQNSKAYIKQLKRTNETLFSELQFKTNHKGKSHNKSVSSSAQKTQKSKSRHNKSTSHYKPPNRDKSIKQIIKTEYIERQRSNSGNRKGKKKVKFGVYSTISGHQGQYRDRSRTFQVISKKQKITASKKKNKHGFSNFTLLNMLEASNKRPKRQQKVTKSPAKLTKRKQGLSGGKKNKGLNRQKKINRSIFSVASVDPFLSSKKQTI